MLEWECCARTMALLQLLNSIKRDSSVSALSITPTSCFPQPYLTGPTFQVWNKPMQANPVFQAPVFAWHHLFLLQRLQQAYSGCCPSNLPHRRSCQGTAEHPTQRETAWQNGCFAQNKHCWSIYQHYHVVELNIELNDLTPNIPALPLFQTLQTWPIWEDWFSISLTTSSS